MPAWKERGIRLVHLIEGVAPMYVLATVTVVLAFIGAVIFVPSSRPSARLVRIIRAWRRRS